MTPKKTFSFYSHFHTAIFNQVENNSNKIDKGQVFTYYLSISILYKCISLCKSLKHFKSSVTDSY